MTCTHTKAHRAEVKVGFMEDSGRFIADVTIVCADCGEPFRFLGLPAGVSFERPMVSIDSCELHVPIEPQGVVQLHSSASFHMPPRETRQ